MYLFAQIRAASSASEDSCSYSSDTRCTQCGKSSTEARLRPRSKMRICRCQKAQTVYPLAFGSGTPLRTVSARATVDTPIEARLGERLVLAVTVAASWSVCESAGARRVALAARKTAADVGAEDYAVSSDREELRETSRGCRRPHSAAAPSEGLTVDPWRLRCSVQRRSCSGEPRTERKRTWPLIERRLRFASEARRGLWCTPQTYRIMI